MSEKIFNKPDYKVPVVTPANYAAAETAGTIEEGLLYNITGESPDVIQGTTAPTSATAGKVGDTYLALISGVWRVWDCIAVNGSATTWRERVRDVQVDGTSKVADGVANINKSDFAGSIASGNTGFVTGGVVYSALEAKQGKGKVTIGGSEHTLTAHTVTIVTNGTTSTFTVLGV